VITLSGNIKIETSNGGGTLNIDGGEVLWNDKTLTGMRFEQFDVEDIFDIHNPNPVSDNPFQFIKGEAIFRVNRYPAHIKKKIDKKEIDTHDIVRIWWLKFPNMGRICILTKVKNNLSETFKRLIEKPFRYRVIERSGGKFKLLRAAPNKQWANVQKYAPDGVTISNDLQSESIEIPSDTDLQLDENGYVKGDIKSTDVYQKNKSIIDQFDNKAMTEIVEAYQSTASYHQANVDTYNKNIYYLVQALPLKFLGK